MSEPTRNNSTIYTSSFTSWQESVPHLLDASGLPDRLAAEKKILIKPNLVEPRKPPITTPVELVEVLVDYIQTSQPHLEIIIGEGCGSSSNNTLQIFETLGYSKLADRTGVTLLDLNEASLVHMQDSNCKRWPEMYLPSIVFESFLISVPVLKAHSLAGVTLTMKNMMGCAPPEHYGGLVWKKSKFHKNLHRSIFELNLYRTPDLTIIDGSVGLARYHLGGPKCKPPVRKLVGGFDPVAVDSYGAGLLCLDWRKIKHIALAHSVLGNGEAQPVNSLDAKHNEQVA